MNERQVSRGWMFVLVLSSIGLLLALAVIGIGLWEFGVWLR